MHLRLTYAELSASPALAVTALGAYATTYDVPSGIPSGGYMRIAHGNVANSAVHYLASHRNNANPNEQMPPIGTHVVDPTGVGYLNTWISQLP
jgi:hypothetical protein